MAVALEELKRQKFRGPKLNPDIDRPRCRQHPDSRVVADGWYSTWNKAQRRPRFRCRQYPGDKGHEVRLTKRVRHPTQDHPHHGEACPNCEHEYTRYEGPRVGEQFVFTFHEIADTLMAVGRLDSMRAASQATRRAALRWMDPPDPARLAKLARAWVSQTASRECNLAADYIDAFAQPIIDRWLPKDWPRAISLDSKPLKTVGARTNKRTKQLQLVGDMPAGEILIAYDQTVIPARPVAVMVAGGRSAAMFRRFFRSLNGQPEWVVADQDEGIRLAVEQQWPTTVLYHSRSHIRRLFEDALAADNIPRMVRIASREEAEASRYAIWPFNQVREFELHPVWAALKECQRSEAEWEKLKALVEKHIPKRRRNLRQKLADYEEKVLEQIATADAHPGMPVGTGAVEGNIAERISRLQRRAGRFQNWLRLNRILKLCLIDLRGDANRDAYASLLRLRFESQAGRSEAEWARWRDDNGGSLPRVVMMALREAAAEEAEAKKRARVDLATRRRDAANAKHAAAGRPPAHTGTRRAKGARVTIYRSVKGMVLTDFPNLMAEYHPTRNAGLDPSQIRAGSNQLVWWQHQGPPPHDGHLHEWQTRVNERTGRDRGCKYCENLAVCDGNSLAKRDPEVAAELHPTKNKGVTADQIIVGSRDFAWWKCRKCRFVWRARVFSRTKGFSGCKRCHERELAQRTREGQKRAKERKRAKAQTLRVIADPPPDELF